MTKQSQPKSDPKRAEIVETVKRYGHCRAVCHFWDNNGPIETHGRDFKVTHICQNCHAMRVTIFNAHGYVVGHHHKYIYPVDFSVKGEKVTKAQARVLVYLER